MTAVVKKKVWTDEEFMSLPDEGSKYEVADGELVVSNTGMEHGDIGAFLAGSLLLYVRAKKLGVVCDSSTGFRMKSGNIRSPDVSFMSKDRLQGLKRPLRMLFQGSPDLAVEILSPTDTVEGVHTKIVEYFENETCLLWVINPEEQFALVYHTPQPDLLLRGNDCLDGENVVPDFSLAVSELFAEFDF